MNYAQKAGEIESKIAELETASQTLKNNSLSSVWQGNTATSLLENLNKYITALDKEVENLKKFVTALEQTQNYKENNEQIKELETTLSNIPDTEENQESIHNLTNDISVYKTTNNTLKSSINSEISNITPITSTNTKVSYTIGDNSVSLDAA